MGTLSEGGEDILREQGAGLMELISANKTVRCGGYPVSSAEGEGGKGGRVAIQKSEGWGKRSEGEPSTRDSQQLPRP